MKEYDAKDNMRGDGEIIVAYVADDDAHKQTKDTLPERYMRDPKEEIGRDAGW